MLGKKSEKKAILSAAGCLAGIQYSVNLVHLVKLLHELDADISTRAKKVML